MAATLILGEFTLCIGPKTEVQLFDDIRAVEAIMEYEQAPRI